MIPRFINDTLATTLDLIDYPSIPDVKRLIGRRASETTVPEDMKLWPFKVVAGNNDKPKIVVTHKGQKKEFSAEEISSMVLAKMKGIAETYLGSSVEKAVITVPAYFNDSQRQSTKDAAMVAGFEVIRMINEPTAAAIAYALDKRSDEDGKVNVLVFDLGGGTFDVSILTIDEKGTINVKATGGDTHLGGEDFDNRMVNYYVQEFNRKHKQDISNNLKALGRLRVYCERAKRIVSTASQTMIDIDCLFNGVDFSTKFTRAKFEEVNMDLFKKFIEHVETCFKDANMERESVNEVVLVGGSSRIPKVQELLQELFNGKRLCQQLNPDEAVAHGAGIFAANLSGIGNKAMQSLVLIDVTPLSLGVGQAGDVMCVLIPRNSPIPRKRETELCTILDNQTTMHLPVYQGERSKASENYLLGEFTLYGLPLAPRGEVKVNVSYEIDVNGILNVSARETTTGTKNTIKITDTGNLSKAKIDKMIKDAENYKIEDKAYMNKASAHARLEVYFCNLRSKILRLRENGINFQGMNNIEHKIEKTLKWLDENPNAEIDELKNRFGNSCKHIKLEN